MRSLILLVLLVVGCGTDGRDGRDSNAITKRIVINPDRCAEQAQIILDHLGRTDVVMSPEDTSSYGLEYVYNASVTFFENIEIPFIGWEQLYPYQDKPRKEGYWGPGFQTSRFFHSQNGWTIRVSTHYDANGVYYQHENRSEGEFISAEYISSEINQLCVMKMTANPDDVIHETDLYKVFYWNPEGAPSLDQYLGDY